MLFKGSIIMKYIVKNITKSKVELYVTHHQMENGMWRSKDISDARRFVTKEAAQQFINRMHYPSVFIIEQIDL